MSGRLRIVSANLWNGHADPEAFARLVESLQPDVVAVQEIAPEHAEALARVMRHGALVPARDHRGMGLALRRRAVVRRVALPYREAHVADVSLGDGVEPAEVLNVHILAPHAQPPWWMWRVRRGQVRALTAYLDATPRRHRVVVGDLNATPLWPAYRRLTARLADGAVQAARQNGHRPRPTWGPWPGAPRLLRIDHILVSGLAVEQVRVLAIPGSDHSAVVADLSLTPASAAQVP